jgi:hypothetical protein
MGRPPHVIRKPGLAPGLFFGAGAAVRPGPGSAGP